MRFPPWYETHRERLAHEREVLSRLPYFRLEDADISDQGQFIAIGILRLTQPRSGKQESFRIRLAYPANFPRREQDVYDHDQRFQPCLDGHQYGDYRLCLSAPERKEFSTNTPGLTEEVLGASLLWFQKRGIFERSGRIRWPGPAEEHGPWGRILAILDQEGLGTNDQARQWARAELQRAQTERTYQAPDPYNPCLCGQRRKMKFCHGDQVRPLLHLLVTTARGTQAPGGK